MKRCRAGSKSKIAKVSPPVADYPELVDGEHRCNRPAAWNITGLPRNTYPDGMRWACSTHIEGWRRLHPQATFISMDFIIEEDLMPIGGTHE